MKRFRKIVVVVLLLLLVVAGGAMSYVKFALPDVGEAPKLEVDKSAEKIARGEYLANGVCACMECHSKRDWTKFAGPLVEGTEGKGGELFDQKLGFPGSYSAKNITPFGIGNWTDGEVFRAITCGVNREGKALFPIMPYHYYGQMDPEDIHCIIAYLRTLPSVNSTPPESTSDFPVSLFINTMPHKGAPVKRPDPSDKVAYGKYLATAAACVECHTPAEKGQIIEGKEFSGGREFPMPDGSTVRSANLTPDKETGLGEISRDAFIGYFRSRSDSTMKNNTLTPGSMNTLMPWTMYGKMNDEDLEALYTYLQSLSPITNPVEKYTPAH